MPAPDDRDVLAGLRTRVGVPPVDGIVRRGKRRRRRRRLVAAAAGLLVAAGAGLGTTAANRGGGPEQVAVGAGGGAAAELGRILRDDANPTFPTDPIGGVGRLACVDGQEVRVFDFGTVEERRRADARIDRDDPSNLGSVIVSWSGTPRLWVDDELIVMYSGPDEAVVATLERALGAPFAVGQGRETDAAAFSCGASTAAAPPPPEPEPAVIVADPQVALPGQEVALRFPTAVERGVPYYLSRWNGRSWDDPTFLLISDGGGAYDCAACPASFGLGQDWGWDDVGVAGTGPDIVVVPPDAPPGNYRACTANTGDATYCVQIEVVAPDETEPRRVVEAFLDAVAAGDVDGAARFVDEYALGFTDGGLDGWVAAFGWLVAADAPEVFVTPTAVTDADTEVMDVTLAVHAPDGSTGTAAAFLVGRAPSGEPTILRLPSRTPASEPAAGEPVRAGDRIVIPHAVPVEGGAVAHVNGEPTTVEVLVEERALAVEVAALVGDHAVVTVSVATPEHPASFALYFAPG